MSQIVDSDKKNNIYFCADVTPQTICELIKAINIIYSRTIQKEQVHNTVISDNKSINLYITSHGGNAEFGLIGYEFIKSLNIPIHTFALGFVHSAATLLFLAGQKRFISPYSSILIHQIATSIDGNMDEIECSLDNMKIMMNSYVSIYENETNLTKAQIHCLMKKNRVIIPNDSIKFGFAHKINKQPILLSKL